METCASLFWLPGISAYKGSKKPDNESHLQAEPVYSPQDYALFFQSGEEIGFAWFFRQLYPSLTFFANKIVGEPAIAEEIASTAFIKIWERHTRFSSPEGIKGYLYQIVRNDALKSLNKKVKGAKVYDVSRLQVADQQENQFQALVAAETSRQLLETISLLPPECSRIFRLLYFEGKTVKETAQQLNLSQSTVKTQKTRGLAVLRKKLASIFLVF